MHVYMYVNVKICFLEMLELCQNAFADTLAEVLASPVNHPLRPAESMCWCLHLLRPCIVSLWEM